MFHPPTEWPVDREAVFYATRSVAFPSWLTPFKFLTVIAAVSPFHSMRPSHSGKGGFSGRASPISYRHAFWLLEPELRTRIFMYRWLCYRKRQCRWHANWPPANPVMSHRSEAPGLQLACPALVSASIWARFRRTKNADIVVLQGHTVRPRLAHYMQTVESSVRTQSRR